MSLRPSPWQGTKALLGLLSKYVTCSNLIYPYNIVSDFTLAT